MNLQNSWQKEKYPSHKLVCSEHFFHDDVSHCVEFNSRPRLALDMRHAANRHMCRFLVLYGVSGAVGAVLACA